MPPLILLLSAACLPGCVVYDIQEEIATANQNLETINDGMGQIEQANKTLLAVNENLDRINAQLALIDERLASMEGRIESVQATIETIGEHMASFRETINNLDALIPLIDISGDDPADRETLEEESDEPTDRNPPP